MAKRILFLVVCLTLASSLPAQELEETDTSAKLAAIKRLCVAEFIGVEPHASQAREMAIASLFSTKTFRVTENCDGADAILKGSLTQSQELRTRTEGESVNFGKAASYASGSVVGSGGTVVGSGDAAAVAVKGGDSEVLSSSETISQAALTLRIVDGEGEILWAHIEEAKAGKVKGPVAFAMDRAVDRLVREIAKAKKKNH